MERKIIRVGSRKSKLALLQTDLVCKAIEERLPFIKTEVIPFSTKGDENLEIALSKIGGKGLFTKELEAAISEGRIDMAVHSAKDMPMSFEKGLFCTPVLGREDPADWIIAKDERRLEEREKGYLIGTSSLRREIQLKEINPSIRVKSIRGNVLTRLGKLRAGEYDAIVLAAAGVRRLTARLGEELMEGLFIEKLSPESFLPAAAQGILAVEAAREELREILEKISEEDCRLAYEVERSFLDAIDADCNAPYGIYCRRGEGEEVLLFGGYGHGRMRKCFVRTKREEAVKSAKKMAEELMGCEGKEPIFCWETKGEEDE
ncbi:MAG: hydroxymethylbilane synthase [Johnsonella sp.]|nr:hydroxymethylbilane synthase [Johnsonella sp.]